ncbi:MAG: Maf family protein [Limisphaerales bacterium]
MNLPPVILASASPRRVELLRQIVFRFRVLPSAAPECEHEQFTAWEVAQLNAHRKARLIAKQHPDHLVIGADTVVCLGTKFYNKPADAADARRMLRELSGKTHQVVTGVCLLHLRGHREALFCDTTLVKFHRLTPAVIRQYVATANPLDKAGAYGIQDQGELLVADIHGSYTNVMGLPVERLRAELRAWPAGR